MGQGVCSYRVLWQSPPFEQSFCYLEIFLDEILDVWEFACGESRSSFLGLDSPLPDAHASPDPGVFFVLDRMIEAVQPNGASGADGSSYLGGGSPGGEEEAVVRVGARGLEPPVTGFEIS